jgi:hypothetical protein
MVLHGLELRLRAPEFLQLRVKSVDPYSSGADGADGNPSAGNALSEPESTDTMAWRSLPQSSLPSMMTSQDTPSEQRSRSSSL